MNLFQKAVGYIARSIGLTEPRLLQAAGGRTTTTGELVSTRSEFQINERSWTLISCIRA